MYKGEESLDYLVFEVFLVDSYGYLLAYLLLYLLNVE